ncbi:MAG: tetraacyldisaccharide 4'-kinase [Variovorax sp.]
MKLPRDWRIRSTRSKWLWPLSMLHRGVLATRSTLYQWGWRRSQAVPALVIVVGNVIAGGAGKTPTVLAIARHLRGRGLAVGIVSRGYGRRDSAVREVLGTSTPAQVGDEPLLLHRQTGLPVFVGKRRLAAARALLAAHPTTQIILSDDGLQHLALTRDIEICVFDDRGVGNGWLLPAGPLREPWPRECELVLHTGVEPAFDGGFRSTRGLGDFAVAADGSRVALGDLVGQPLIAYAGIATPEAFFEMLSARGLWLEHAVALPDHHDFQTWKRPADSHFKLVCTEKDAVKLWALAPDALAVPLLFSPEPAFFKALDRLLEVRL